jgi:hypothetical protein
MTMPLPEPRPTTTAGQRHPIPTPESLEQVIREAAAAVAADLPPTSYRDDRQLPETGSAPPKTQPGRTPMSEKASDLSGLMLSAGAASFMGGTPVVGILWASGHANPTVVAIVFGAPAALALAISRVIRRANERAAARPEIHNHGPVHQDNRQDHSRNKAFGIVANNNHPKEKS